MDYSVIIPLFNRPNEIDELLESLTLQNFTGFEVIVVEDGSRIKSDKIIEKYKNTLQLQYFEKMNEGPGLTRNYGAARAQGDYLIFFDSDCIIPADYFEHVDNYLKQDFKDAYGGPDMAHPSFNAVQKAVNYSMTSFLTTGGIRGKKSSLEKFNPRSFNMGISRAAFEKLGGFSPMRFGEDIDMSTRLIQAGYSTCLIEDAGVFHKRRTNLLQFFKQIFNSGIARINLFTLHPESLKLVHFLPAMYTLGMLVLLTFTVLLHPWFSIPWLFFLAVLFIHGLMSTKNLWVAVLIILTSQIQLIAYGVGFISAFFQKLFLRKNSVKTYSKNL